MKILLSIVLFLALAGCTLNIASNLPDKNATNDTEFKRQVVTALQAQDQQIKRIQQEMAPAKAPALNALKKKIKDKKDNEEKETKQ